MRADYELVPWKEDVKKALKASGGDVLCLWHPGWTFPPYILDNRLVWQVLFEINFKLIPVVTLHIWSSSRLCFLNCQSSLHMFNPRNLKHIQTLRGARRAAGQKWISGWKLRDLGRYRPCLLDRRSEHHCNALQRLVLWRVAHWSSRASNPVKGFEQKSKHWWNVHNYHIAGIKTFF